MNNSLLSKRAKIEKILGNAFDLRPEKLYFYKCQPNGDLVYSYSYFKAKISQDEYTNMLKDSTWYTLSSKGDALLYLPSDWKLQPGMALDWWSKSPNTPPDAAVKKASEREWVIVKFEDGFLYGIHTKN